MWATEKTKKEKRGAEPEMSLQMYINSKRAKLLDEKTEISRMTDECEVILREINGMTMRWQTRLRREKEKERTALLAQVEEIQSMSRVTAFEKKIRPYVIEANKRPHVAVEDEGKMIVFAPGTNRTPLDGFVEHKSNKKGKTLLNELRTEFKDAVPKISIENSNNCPKCGLAMVIQQSKAIICCPSCGYMASYIDSTSMSMSYTDDVEFACFSYKRTMRRVNPPPHPPNPFFNNPKRRTNPAPPRFFLFDTSLLATRFRRDKPFQRMVAADPSKGVHRHIR